MSFLIALFARWGLPECFRKPLATATLVLGAALLLWAAWSLWLWQHDRSVIAQDRAGANAIFREKQIEAERKAGAKKDERDERDRASQQELKEKADEAAQAGDSPADAVWNGLWD